MRPVTPRPGARLCYLSTVLVHVDDPRTYQLSLLGLVFLSLVIKRSELFPPELMLFFYFSEIRTQQPRP